MNWKRYLLIFPMLLIMAASAFANPVIGQKFKIAEQKLVNTFGVMSFNIRYENNHDGDNIWDNRIDLVKKVIIDADPEILGVQEGLKSQIDDLDETLPGYDYIGVGRDDGETKGEYCAIFFKHEYFEVDDYGTFWFSDTPDVAGSITWGNACTRICTWARFMQKKSKIPFYVYNLHLDHQSQESRQKSVELLLKMLNTRISPDPYIIMGDFNAGENSEEIKALKNAPISFQGKVIHGAMGIRVNDTFRIKNPNRQNVGTFNGFEGRQDGEKIDYIFVSPRIGTKSAEIITYNVDGRYPSDHFPVYAEIGIQ